MDEETEIAYRIARLKMNVEMGRRREKEREAMIVKHNQLAMRIKDLRAAIARKGKMWNSVMKTWVSKRRS